MEDIYVNVDHEKVVTWVPSTVPTGSSSSKWIIRPAVTVFLLLFSLLLVVGLIVLGVHYRGSVSDSSKLSVIRDNLTVHLQDAEDELSSLKTNLTKMIKELQNQVSDSSKLSVNLTARLQDAEDELSSLTAERDLLKTNLTKMIKELQRCPAGWTKFRSSCYLESTDRRSWSKAREDCRTRGADLVVIDSSEEQTFLSTFTNKDYWIGLHDQEVEGTWRWVDGSDLTLTNWGEGEPNNVGGDQGIDGEDCVHIRSEDYKWNDLPCQHSTYWICEKHP